jgi:hypothetical protein
MVVAPQFETLRVLSSPHATRTKSINYAGKNVFGEESPDGPSFPLFSLPGM